MTFLLNIILLGAPGSGKGTQAKRLSLHYSIPQISTGDLFRENIAKDTSVGREAKSYIEAGQLVPDDFVLEMLFARIASPDCKNGFLLDGFPRTIFQAEQLAQQLNFKTPPHVLCLQVPDEEIVNRAAGRLVCERCGAIYHLRSSPPKLEGVCDRCEGVLHRRSDDDPDVVWKRLKVYHEQTEPLENYYKQLGCLTAFDGRQSPDEVFSELKKLIDRHTPWL